VGASYVQHRLFRADQDAEAFIRLLPYLSPTIDDERVLTGNEGRPQERHRTIGANVGGGSRAQAR